MRRRMVPRCKVWLLGFGRLRASGRRCRSECAAAAQWWL